MAARLIEGGTLECNPELGAPVMDCGWHRNVRSAPQADAGWGIGQAGSIPSLAPVCSCGRAFLDMGGLTHFLTRKPLTALDARW